MSTTIPYDPTLVLGNIVPEDHLKVLESISELQTPVDSALNELNSAILLKRKLSMTEQDLINMGIPTKDLAKELVQVGKEVEEAATKYAKVSVGNLPKIAQQRSKIPQVGDSIESPIDYNRSALKQMPLAADSLTMDAQYFSFDETGQSSASSMAAMKAYISAATSRLGSHHSAKMSSAAQAQVNSQRENHDIQGTLVITANCTHRQAAVFAPFMIDVDKGIRAWNELVADGKLKGEMIKTNDPASLAKIAKQQQTKKAAYFNLLSGATYGSSFVGMVHVLKASSTQSSQQMYSAAASLQTHMKVAGWFRKKEGGFGVSSTFANSAKQLLSSQQISSHISLVVMGVIPTIEANDVALAVKQFSNFDPASMMGELSTIQNATADDQASVASEADNSLTGQQVLSIQASKIQSAMSAVAEINDGQNKMLDINSLMTAFTDYVTKAAAGDCGVPLEYYLKPITASQLAQMWVAKYLPGEYITSAGDDSNPAEPGKEGSSGDSGDSGDAS